MSFNSWRQFQFFDNIPISDSLLASNNTLFSDPSVSSIASLTLLDENSDDTDLLLVGYDFTRIKICSLKYSKILIDFNAYEAGYEITKLQNMIHLPSFFISVAECSGKPALIKVWKYSDNLLKNENSYHSLVEANNTISNNTFPISAISFSIVLNCIAVGYTDGSIILIRGDIYRDRGSKQRIIYYDSQKEPITNLALEESSTYLFVSTTSKIMVFSTHGRNNKQPDLILNNENGVDLYCGQIDLLQKNFICVTKDSLDTYTFKGEKKSLSLDVPSKTQLFQIDENRILLVSDVDSSSYTSKAFSGMTNNSVNILDIRNKLVSMSAFIPSQVIHIFTFKFDGIPSIMLFSSDHKLYKITEKPIADQLQIVLQRELYPIALNIASQNSKAVSTLDIKKIEREYGDYLYKKGAKTKAMEQYIRCIDTITETSEIISKYSIAQGDSWESIKSLTKFLWALVKKGLAQIDHVTLLLVTMIKLKDRDGINTFINHYTRDGTYSEKASCEDVTTLWGQADDDYFYSTDVPFDLEKVVSLLKDVDFNVEAYKLCRKFSKDPADTVDILLNTLKDPVSALRYTKSLPVDDALRVLISYSKIFLDYLPNDTNALLIEIFIGKYKPEIYSMNDSVLNNSSSEVNNNGFNNKMVFHNYASFFSYMNNSSVENQQNYEPTYHPPRPNLIFTSFVGKPYEFVVFLEACLESYKRFKGFDNDKQEVLTTLYNLYLSLSEEESTDNLERKDSWREKAAKIFEESEELVKSSHSSATFPSEGIENSLMVLISHLHNFNIDQAQSLQFGAESDHMSKFRTLLLKNEPTEVIRYLHENGEKEFDLYRSILRHVVSSKSIFELYGGDAGVKKNILEPIKELQVMDSLEIIRILSMSEVASFGLIKDALLENLQDTNREIENNQKLSTSYKNELDGIENEIEKLFQKDASVEIKMSREICKICQTILELPVVYFKCGHAYHQKCLNEEFSSSSTTDDNKTESAILEESHSVYKCPQCLLELETSGKLYKAQLDFANKEEEEFNIALTSAEGENDCFNVVTEYIGKGCLENSYAILE
ncbi:tethering complex subunit PEP5 SCDLUD_000814 [Saccharomycodes ludwigii]|uniref:tethering complex subunit PEP5 n=1 Tax=Saccharomycodes ludwigii TaxID=36035 RepID=UPI001E8B9E4C|nr:hypothetical protein SCDLUD_000814 [Saccharomycodes ludwigii]KAH3903196.1 hypothetical protein SCDLUD_000814 [Saccharomycodes ludwigii]